MENYLKDTVIYQERHPLKSTKYNCTNTKKVTTSVKWSKGKNCLNDSVEYSEWPKLTFFESYELISFPLWNFSFHIIELNKKIGIYFQNFQRASNMYMLASVKKWLRKCTIIWRLWAKLFKRESWIIKIKSYLYNLHCNEILIINIRVNPEY